MPTARLSIRFGDRRISYGDRPLQLTKRFFHLYCFLALQRLDNPSQEGGWTDPQEILCLPFWGRNDALSAGKQIRRHMQHLKTKTLHLIECQQKVKGPFRLAVAARHIALDCSLETLRGYLLSRSFSRALLKEAEQRFFGFVEELWQGDVCFADGRLEEALTAFQKALRLAITPHQVAASQNRIGRALERLGSYNEAASVHLKTLKEYGTDGPFSSLVQARTQVLLAWVRYRQNRLDEAERLYYTALALVHGEGHHRILGDIFNGLGKIHEARKEYEGALGLYQQALEYWALAEYYYGIQAIYFNLGRLYATWGDHQSLAGRHGAATAMYQTAVTWVQHCMEVCKKVGIGYETSQDHILIADLYLKLEQPENALKAATEALNMAISAQNKKDIAEACRIKAKVHWARGERNQVLATIEQSKPHLIGSQFLQKLEEDLRSKSVYPSATP